MTLETERLFIRPWTTDDIADYAAIVADAAVMKYLGNGKPQSYQEASDYVLANIDRYATDGWSRFPVFLKSSNALIGFCGYSIYRDELDLGWRYGQAYWRNGYATEAAQAVLQWGADKFPRIVCISYAENTASIRVIEKIGMTFETEFVLNEKIVCQYVKAE